MINFRNTVPTILKICITVGIFCYLFFKFDIRFQNIFQTVTIFPFIVMGLFCRLTVVPVISVNRWKLFLRYTGINEKFFTLLKISFVASFMGIVLPSAQGGDIMRMYLIEKRHHGIEKNGTSSSSVLIERMIGMVLLAFTGLISCILAPSFPRKEHVLILVSVVTTILCFTIFILTNQWIYSHFSKFLFRIKRLKKFTQFISKTHYSLVNFPYGKVLLPSIILILLLQLSTIAIVYFVFLAFDVNIPFYQHLVFYPMISIVSVIPVAISGLGLREGLFVYFYSMIGVPAEMAIGISLVNYAVMTLSAATVGGIIYAVNGLKITSLLSSNDN